MKKLTLMTMVALLAQPALAEEERMVSQENCKTEEVTIYTNHTYNGYTVEEGDQRLASDKKKIAEVANNAGVTLKLTSESSSISPFTYEGPNVRGLFNYAANLNYQVKPPVKGKEFFRQLSAAGVNVSLNYSSNDSCEEAQGE